MGRNKTISDVELLDVARTVFVEAGFAASTKEIARRAGISEGVIFQRFSTKEELFFAAMIPPPVDLNQLLHHPQSHGLALLEKITFSMIEYFRETLPVMIPLMTHPSFKFEEFSRKHPDSPLFVLRMRLVQFFAQQRHEGNLGDADPGAAAFLVWSTAHSVVFFERLGAHGGRIEPEIIRSTVRSMWTGLAPK